MSFACVLACGTAQVRNKGQRKSQKAKGFRLQTPIKRGIKGMIKGGTKGGTKGEGVKGHLFSEEPGPVAGSAPHLYNTPCKQS